MASALIGAAFSVLLKALSPVMDPVLAAWAASKNLDRKVLDLKMELLCVKAVLEGNLDMEIHNAALGELLQNLHDLAYDAEDVLDELDYFRIWHLRRRRQAPKRMRPQPRVQHYPHCQGCWQTDLAARMLLICRCCSWCQPA